MSDQQTIQTNLDPRGEAIVIQIPMRFERRGGRKLVIAPDDPSSLAPSPPKRNSSLIRAIGRAHRWQRILNSGACSTITELAEAEKVNVSYICRILRLTLLAPTVVDAILDGRQSKTLQLADMLQPLPANWDVQIEKFLRQAAGPRQAVTGA